MSLDDIKARWAKATPGPWNIDREDGCRGDIDRRVCAGPATVASVCEATYPDGEWLRASHDAAAIAHAPEDIAWLVARDEELSKKLQAARDCRAIANARAEKAEAEVERLRAGLALIREKLALVGWDDGSAMSDIEAAIDTLDATPTEASSCVCDMGKHGLPVPALPTEPAKEPEP